MNVVDSLVVTLGLDASNFKTGQLETQDSLKRVRDDATVTAKDLQAQGAKAAEFFSSVKTEALSLIGVLVGSSGLAAFVNDTSKSLAQAGRDARSIGEAVPGVEAFAAAIARMGGTTGGATSALQAFASLQANARLFGDPQFVQQMGLIGGNIDTKPLEAMKLFMAYIEKYKDTPNGIQNIESIANKIFPGIDRGTLQALEQIGSVPELMRQLGLSYQLGVPTPEMAEHATALQTALTALGQAAKYDGEMMEDSASHGMTHFLNVLTQMIDKNPQALVGIAAFGGWLTVIAGLNFKSVLGFFAEALPILALLGFTGPAGSEDQNKQIKEDEEKHAQYLRDHPDYKDPWTRLKSWWNGDSASPGAPLAPDVEAEVRRQASLRGLDADHMVRLAQQEQGGYNNVSPAGAFGPMQLMPDTAASVGVRQGGPWQDNVRGGMDYYYQLLQKFGGNYQAADAAYNAGPANPGVKRFFETGDPSGLPTETKKYVAGINGSAPNGVPPPGPIFGAQQPNIPAPPRLAVAQPAPAAGNTMHFTFGDMHLPNVTNSKDFAANFWSDIVPQANRGPT